VALKVFEGCQPPVIQNQKIITGQLINQMVVRTVAPGGSQFRKQIGDTIIPVVETMPAVGA
jgi:hypothetical protein